MCPQRVQKGVLSAPFVGGHITDWRVCSSISATTVASLASLHALYVPTEPSATMLCTNTCGPNTQLLLLTNELFGHHLFHLFKNPVFISFCLFMHGVYVFICYKRLRIYEIKLALFYVGLVKHNIYNI